MYGKDRLKDDPERSPRQPRMDGVTPTPSHSLVGLRLPRQCPRPGQVSLGLEGVVSTWQYRHRLCQAAPRATWLSSSCLRTQTMNPRGRGGPTSWAVS